VPQLDIPSLRFADFFRSPIGPRGLEISDKLRESDGQSVRLVGYMVRQESPHPGRFMLVPRPVQISKDADGEADDLPPSAVQVYLDPAQAAWLVPHVRGLVAITGHLRVGRFEASDGRVSWVRLQLGPQAVQGPAPSAGITQLVLPH
jgi:hypothetical protein